MLTRKDELKYLDNDEQEEIVFTHDNLTFADLEDDYEQQDEKPEA